MFTKVKRKLTAGKGKLKGDADALAADGSSSNTPASDEGMPRRIARRCVGHPASLLSDASLRHPVNPAC